MTVFTMGKIQVERFQMVVANLDTDEVIITKERIAHINKRHHGDFDAYQEFIPDILSNPAHILEDRDHPHNTVNLLKAFPADNEMLHFNLVLRLRTPELPPEYRNSIMTFWHIHEKEYRRMVKNRKHY
ncbi:MAG: hypothetical protein IKO14_08835 [Oscillibacter sp.]|nr:hypothetical protein [Oscillibacter sp.]